MTSEKSYLSEFTNLVLLEIKFLMLTPTPDGKSKPIKSIANPELVPLHIIL